MASSTRDIRRRIKSITNTRKVTSAMEVVSAAKMKKAVAAVIAVRSYAHAAWQMLTSVAQSFGEQQHKLLAVREVRSILMIVITSNKGLCGSFNTQLLKKVREQVSDVGKLKVNRVGKKRIDSSISDKDLTIDVATVGKKGEAPVRMLGKDIVATFPDLVNALSASDVRPLARFIMEEYSKNTYDKVVMVYTDYVSVLKQEQKVRQLLPISQIDLEKQIAEMDILAEEYGLENMGEASTEPTPEEVLDDMVPRLLEMQLFHAIMESNASQESSRMLAMKNATDAAGDIVDDLTLAYNQLRQAKITQEISEISAGRIALEG